MEQDLTPCTNVCRIENEVCIGCGRSLEQIENWLDYSHEKKQEIIDNLFK